MFVHPLGQESELHIHMKQKDCFQTDEKSPKEEWIYRKKLWKNTGTTNQNIK
jgi:hypothetical protein